MAIDGLGGVGPRYVRSSGIDKTKQVFLIKRFCENSADAKLGARASMIGEGKAVISRIGMPEPFARNLSANSNPVMCGMC